MDACTKMPSYNNYYALVYSLLSDIKIEEKCNNIKKTYTLASEYPNSFPDHLGTTKT